MNLKYSIKFNETNEIDVIELALRCQRKLRFYAAWTTIFYSILDNSLLQNWLFYAFCVCINSPVMSKISDSRMDLTTKGASDQKLKNYGNKAIRYPKK